MKKVRPNLAAAAVLLALSAILNILAWVSRSFSDFYTNRIFPVITGIYARITCPVPFSVGEWLLVLLVVIIAASAVFLIAELAAFFLRKELPPALKDFIRGYFRVLSVLFPAVFLIMTLNCFILYHTTPLEVSENPRDDYTIEELAALRDYVVERCSELSKEMDRDEEGNVIYDKDMAREAGKAMLGISEEIGNGRLKGFFTRPKELFFSGFMSQQYMQGYYFPFSMEANINGEMYIMNKPFTMCHELAHTHGYIYEDEANLLGFLACISSEDAVFEYSGYLGVLNYVNNDFYNSVDKEVYRSHPAIPDQVKYDAQFLTEEAWKRVEEDAVFDTLSVQRAADAFIDTNLKVNGVASGKASYRHVVKLLLDYYSDHPYN